MLSYRTGSVLLALLASTAPLGFAIQVSQPLNSVPTTQAGPSTSGQGGYNNPGGFYRPGDLHFTDPSLIRSVQGVNPEQVKLIYWGPSSVLVSWATGTATKGPQVSPVNAFSVGSHVLYGTEPGNLTENVEMTANNYVYTQTYQNHSFWDISYSSPIFHYVILTDLDPGQTYYYQVGDPILLAMSQEFSFTMMPDSLPIRIGATADVSTSINTKINIGNLTNAHLDLMLIIGDLVYADIYQANGTINPGELRITSYAGGPFDRSDQERWDMMGRLWQNVTSKVPILTVAGNHETEPQGDLPSKLLHASYNARYPMPQDPTRIQNRAHQGYCNPNDSGLGVNTPGLNPNLTSGSIGACSFDLAYQLRTENAQESNMFYTVDLPSTKIIAMTQYIKYQEGTPQYNFIESTLASINRTEFPWLLVMYHAATYHSFTSAFKEYECHRLIYEPLWVKYGVDVVMSGHTHGYERTFPVVNYEVNECGPVYMLVGNGGQSSVPYFIDNAAQTNAACNTTKKLFRGQETYLPNAELCITYQNGQYCPSSQPAWSALRSQCFGYSVLEVLNSTHALWEMTCQDNPAGQASDSVYLIHGEHNASCATAAVNQGPVYYGTTGADATSGAAPPAVAAEAPVATSPATALAG